MSKKNVYWKVESNAGLSMTCVDPETCATVIKNDFSTLDETEQQETEYTVTPVWLTERQYRNLPEA